MLTALRQTAIFLIAATAAVLIFVLVESFSPFFQRCLNAYSAHDQADRDDKHPEHPGTIVVYAVCSGEFSDHHAGGLTALASILIAAFTATLWITTGRQLRLARDEFNATHRPHIKVLQFETVTEPKGGVHLVSACITYVNRGVSPATITEIASAIVTNSDQNPLRPRAMFTHKQTMAKKLPSGVHSSYMIPDEGIDRDAHKRAHGTGPSGRGIDGYVVHCIGYIEYIDAGSLKRQTGFCRRLSGDGTVWERADQPDYEYEY